MSAQQLMRPCVWRQAAPAAGSIRLSAVRRPAVARRLVCNAGVLEVPAEFTKVRRSARRALCGPRRAPVPTQPASRELRLEALNAAARRAMRPRGSAVRRGLLRARLAARAARLGPTRAAFALSGLGRRGADHAYRRPHLRQGG
jgi:hypothetical protein